MDDSNHVAKRKQWPSREKTCFTTYKFILSLSKWPRAQACTQVLLSISNAQTAMRQLRDFRWNFEHYTIPCCPQQDDKLLYQLTQGAGYYKGGIPMFQPSFEQHSLKTLLLQFSNCIEFYTAHSSGTLATITYKWANSSHWGCPCILCNTFWFEFQNVRFLFLRHLITRHRRETYFRTLSIAFLKACRTFH